MRKILVSCVPLSMDTLGIFVKALIARKASPSYVKQHISLIRQWGECFALHDLQEYKYPKFNYESSFVRATFEDDEIHTFLNAPNPHPVGGTYSLRYEMWIIFYTILFYHGLRTIEISKLVTEYIDFGRNVIIIPKHISKTGQERLIPISPSVTEKLKEYIFTLSQDHLFPAFHKRSRERGVLHVQCNDWERFFNLQIKRIGLKRKNLTPYSGRHTYGSRQSEEDVSVFKIKEIMGHKKVETTMKYVHTSLKSLRKVQENDRLSRHALPGKAQIAQIYHKIREIEDHYVSGILTIITPTDDSKELHIVFKIKKG